MYIYIYKYLSRVVPNAKGRPARGSLERRHAEEQIARGSRSAQLLDKGLRGTRLEPALLVEK